jgi:hypothetical protein
MAATAGHTTSTATTAMAAGTEEEREYLCALLEDRLDNCEYMHSLLYELLDFYSAPTPTTSLIPTASSTQPSGVVVAMPPPSARRSKPRLSGLRSNRSQATTTRPLPPMSRPERTMEDLGYTLRDVKQQIHEHAHTLIKELDLSDSNSDGEVKHAVSRLDNTDEAEDSDDSDPVEEPPSAETFHERYMSQIEQLRKQSPEVVITRVRKKPREVVNLVDEEEFLEGGKIGKDVDGRNSEEVERDTASDQGVTFGQFRVVAGGKILGTGTVFATGEAANKWLQFQKARLIKQAGEVHDGKGVDKGKYVDKGNKFNEGKEIEKGMSIDREKDTYGGRGIDKGKAPDGGKALSASRAADNSKSTGKEQSIDKGKEVNRRKSVSAGELISNLHDSSEGETPQDIDEDETFEYLRKHLMLECLGNEECLSDNRSMAKSTDSDTNTEDDEEEENFLTSLCIRRGYTNQDRIVAAVLWGLEHWPRYEILIETEEHETITDAYLSLLHMLWIQIRGLTEDISPAEKFSKPDEAYKHGFLGRYSTGQI